jgi:hypothetical protein
MTVHPEKRKLVFWWATAALACSMALLFFERLAVGSVGSGVQAELAGFGAGLLAGLAGARLAPSFHSAQAMQWPRSLIWPLLLLSTTMVIGSQALGMMGDGRPWAGWSFAFTSFQCGLPLSWYLLLPRRESGGSGA